MSYTRYLFRLFFLLSLISCWPLSKASAQNISGAWAGTLHIGSITLDLVVNIRQTDTGYTASMDSPDQGAKGIPVKEVQFQNKQLRLLIPDIMMQYEGQLSATEDTINGTFTQRGQSAPLTLTREMKPARLHPQEPQAPYPYYTEDVVFNNTKADIQLAGTLSLPRQKGTFPAVILVSGSGPQDRDEQLLGHKPFLVLADYLTRKGFAVLRYDDRGTAASTGTFAGATTRDFADDAAAALQYLSSRKEIKKKQIGIIGHSEGGIIAPMLAAASPQIAFIVMLAGPGVPGATLLLQQQQAIAQADSIPPIQAATAAKLNKELYDIVVTSANPAAAEEALNAHLRQALQLHSGTDTTQNVAQDAVVRQYINELNNPWIRYFMKYDPSVSLQQVSCPVLALFGERDRQVPAPENAAAVKAALRSGKHPEASVLILPGLNHLFQECRTGSPSEYRDIEETFSPKALREIANWLQYQVQSIH